MHQRHDKGADPGSIPGTGKKVFNGEKWWGLGVQMSQLQISIFQVSFRPSLSLWKIQRKFLKDSQSRRKREQKSLRGNQSRRQRESTHHSSQKLSSSSWRKTRRREKEERKRWRHHLKHQSYVCKKMPSNNIVNVNMMLNWKKYRL